MILNNLDMDEKPEILTTKSFLVQSKTSWTCLKQPGQFRNNLDLQKLKFSFSEMTTKIYTIILMVWTFTSKCPNQGKAINGLPKGPNYEELKIVQIVVAFSEKSFETLNFFKEKSLFVKVNVKRN